MILFSFVLGLSACANQAFYKKPHQTDKQFKTDQAYCRGEALGTWDHETGTSTVGIRSKKMGHQTYEDCMRQLGYEQKME